MKKFNFISALFSGFLLFSCTQDTAKKEILRSVKTDSVKVYGVMPTSDFPGRVKASADANLSFKVAGRMTKIHVGEGDFIKKGQILAEMDDRDYRTQLAATEAEYYSIKAEADRIIELYALGSITPNDHDKAVYGLQQISAKYEAHKNALADTKLTAPFDGYIQKRFYGAGEIVAAGMSVISMLEANTPEVEINIPSSEFIRRDKFSEFTCTVDIYPNKVYSLVLLGITQKANLNQLHTMRLKMKKEEKPLPAPGMAAMVKIRYKPENLDLLSIPHSAVFENNSVSQVWVYNSNTQTVAARNVSILELRGNGAAIISKGLQAGEIVVSAGVHSLKEGERVKLLPAVSSTNIGGML
jgi:RND family efflux transporter MFP subunit